MKRRERGEERRGEREKEIERSERIEVRGVKYATIHSVVQSTIILFYYFHGMCTLVCVHLCVCRYMVNILSNLEEERFRR